MARKVYVQNQTAKQTLKIDVFLNFKGRVSMRNQYTFAFDQDEADKMLFDEPGQLGLKTATNMINNEISETLRINLAGKGMDFTAY